MKLLKISLVIIAILQFSCNNYSNKPKTAEQLKLELKIKEINNPLKYLNSQNVKLKQIQKKIRNAGIFHKAEYINDGAIIQGEIINTATLTKYKDLKVTISFYSKTKSIIDQQSYIIYDYFKPNTTKHFKIRIKKLPEATNTFSFIINNATGLSN